MRTTSRTGAAVALALLLASPAVLAQSPTPAEEENPVVARVDGAEIRLEAVMSMIQDLPEQYRQLPVSTLYPMLVRRAVNNALVSKKAEAAGYADDPDVEADVRAYRDAKMREHFLLDEIEKVVTDEAMQKRYAEWDKAGRVEARVHARHILLKSEDEAKAVIAELQGGADFAETARAKSQGPSATSGGDLGFFSREQMVKPFADAAFAMQPGEISKQPVETQFGWHVIKVEAREKASFEDTRESIQREMSGEVITALLDDLREGATVEELNIDGTPLEQPAAEGGAGKDE